MADSNRRNSHNTNRNQQNYQRKNTSHNIRKRPVPKLDNRETTFWVSTKSSIKALLSKCSELINNNANQIIIYCLGAAIPRGILLALQICEKYPSFVTDTNTLTTELIDDLEPAADDEDFEIQKRFNSALKIRVTRSDLLEAKADKIL